MTIKTLQNTLLALAGFTVFMFTTSIFAADGEKPGRMPVMLNWDYNCQTLSPDDIQKLVQDAKEFGADGINLRISNKGALNCRSTAGGPYTERLDAFGPDYDPLAILIDECRRQGIASCVWCDLFEAAYDPLIQAHPEFSPQGRPGKPYLAGFPCYSHKEVRDHMLAVVDEFARSKPDYVFFCTKSSHIPRNHLSQPHNRDSGFNPPVVEKYKELYGVDILTEKCDVQKLGKIRGDFLVDFLVEAKKRLDQAGVKTIVGATVSGRLQPGGPNLLLDWREIVRRRAADILLMANSRGEYYAFYDEKGQKLYREIVNACHEADMQFYAYIISSGTLTELPKKVGFAGLQDYLPRQLDYLAAMGADGVLIHDLDLFSLDRGIRRSLWSALLNRSNLAELKTVAQEADTKRLFPIPQPQLPAAVGVEEASTSHFVPGGSFEADRPVEWYVQSSWVTDPRSPVNNGSFERSDAKYTTPNGWKFQPSAQNHIEGVYDWKVMHDDPTSGRTFHGRSSLLLQVTDKPRDASAETAVEDGAAKSEARWQAEFSPVATPMTGQVAQVQVHGEELADIEAVGFQLELLDADGKTLHTYRKLGPNEGTFAWQPIAMECDFSQETATVRASLLLSTTPGEASQGRVWFDQFELGPSLIPKRASRLISDLGEHGGFGLVAQMEPGLDLVSVPFRMEKPGKYRLQIPLRSSVEQTIQVLWQGKKDFKTQATVDRQGVTIELPLEITGVEPAARIVIRPTKEGALELKPIRLRAEE